MAMSIFKLRNVGYRLIGQLAGITSGAGTCLLWNYAMWGPTSVLSLSGTSFSGAFVMSIFAIVTVIASLNAHSKVLFLMFFVSFCPIGFFFLTEAHWLRFIGMLNLGYLVAALLTINEHKTTAAINTKKA